MLATSTVSDAEVASCSVSTDGADFRQRVFGASRRSLSSPDGALATFHESCRRHRVRSPPAELIEVLLGEEADRRQGHLTAIRTLDFSLDYVAPRHLMVLADFLRVVDGPAFQQQRLRFSLVPFLEELVLCGLTIDFNISETAHFHIDKYGTAPEPEPSKISGNGALRYLFAALTGHPSLRRLDLSSNALGPSLLPALHRLIKQTPSLVEVSLSGTLLSQSEQDTVHAMCLLNKLRLDREDPVFARERVRDEWQRQQDAWFRRILQAGEPLAPQPTAATSPYIATASGRPVLRYRLPKEDLHLLSQACLDVVRAAFVNTQVASITALQGRAVPRGVPGPPPLPFAAKNEATLARLCAQVSESALMRCLREQVLPLPPNPPSRYAHLGDTFRSTKEDHYAHIIATQRKQWDVLVAQLVKTMVPSTLAAGARLFHEGAEAYWLTFVPRSREEDTDNCSAEPYVEVELSATDATAVAGNDTTPTGKPAPAADAGTPSYRVASGQFIGEDDLLRASPHYVVDKYAVTSAPTSASLTRTCTAHVRPPLSSSSAASSDVGVTVWQIPRDVAWFFLFHPFQALHRRTARLLKVFPSLRAAAPPLLARLAYALQPVSVTAFELRDVPSNTGDNHDPRLQAHGAQLTTHVYVLEEGEFYLGHTTANGRWSEQSLDGGVAVMNAASLAPDETARRNARFVASSREDHTGAVRGPRGEKLGKEAFERYYRETQRRQQSCTEPSSPGDATTVAPPMVGTVNAAAVFDAALSLGGNSSHWKYYVIPNAVYASLPQCVRLALTATYVHIGA